MSANVWRGEHEGKSAKFKIQKRALKRKRERVPLGSPKGQVRRTKKACPALSFNMPIIYFYRIHTCFHVYSISPKLFTNKTHLDLSLI